MAWHGTLDKEGTEYFRFLRNADNTIDFLTKLKKHIDEEKIPLLEETIQAVTTHVNKVINSSNQKLKDL